MARKQSKPIDLKDAGVQEIAGLLLADFKARGLGAAELHSGYEGPTMNRLREQCCTTGDVTEVDFDLAFKVLEDGGLVRTGPMAAFDNKPGSNVMIIGLYSKREFARLTEEGYRVATRLVADKPPRPYVPNVRISGNFHNSPIGVGHNVSQEMNISNTSLTQLTGLLREAVEQQVEDTGKRSAILARIDALEAAEDKPTMMERYTQLVGVIGDHISVFGFLLPPILHYLMS